MDVKVKNIDALNAVMTVKISNSDYNESFENSLKSYKKQIQLPGFRKGHIPTTVIKKKYGPSILAEEIDKLLNETIYKHITENKLNILGNPLPLEENKPEIDWKNPGDFEFTYELGMAPDFNLDLPGRDKHTRYKLKVDEKLIKKQMTDFAKRYGKLVGVDSATESDMVVSTFQELDESGNIVEGGFSQSSTISLEFVEDKKVKKQLIGIKPNDILVIDPKKISRGDADMAAMLGIDKERAVLYTRNVKMNVTEVKRLEPTNIDVALFDKIYGPGEVKTEQEFKERIQAELEKMFIADSDRIFKKEVTKTIIKKLKLKLPDEFLKKWILTSNKEADKEQVEKEYDMYSEGLKWQLIENKIIKEQELKVEHEELINHTKELMGSQYAQYGMMVPAEEELMKTVQNVLSNKEEARKINDMIFDTKVMDYLKSILKINEKQLLHEDFIKKASEAMK